MARNRLELKYRIEIHWSPEDEAYVARIPELPGCATHGHSQAHALRMAQEAMELHIESLRSRGMPIPRPLAEQKFSGKIPLRIHPVLHRDLAIKAAVEGMSLNKYIEKKLKRG